MKTTKKRTSKILIGGAVLAAGALLFSAFKAKANSTTSATAEFSKYKNPVAGIVKINTTADQQGKIVEVAKGTKVNILGIYPKVNKYMTSLGIMNRSHVAANITSAMVDYTAPHETPNTSA